MNAATLTPVLRFVLTERGWPRSERLDRLAGRFPAIAAAGIEFALDGSGPIDVQQMLRTPEDAHRLLDFCRTAGREIGGRFDATRIHDLIVTGLADEVWLEMDDDGAAAPPSIFVRIGRSAGESDIDRLLRLLAAAGTVPPPLQRHLLEDATSSMPAGAFISHLGIMRGRPGSPLRLIVDGIPLPDLGAYLAEIRWPGDMPEALGRAGSLASYCDRIRIALTLDGTLRPEIGFECFVGAHGRPDPRWRGLIAGLAAEGLADTKTGRALLDWPALITPRSASHPWPERLVLDDLLRGKRQAGWIESRISHVKVTAGPDAAPRAKAYVGFVEVTDPSDQDRTASAPTPPPGVSGNAPRMTRSPGEACAAAIRFLLDARTQTGWWLDFDGFAEGTSDEWVTAYVGHVLAGTTDEAGRAAANRAWTLLRGRARVRPGWGWNSAEPADADTTAWAIRLAQRLGQGKTPPAIAAVAFLREHVDASGGVATYLRAHHEAWSGGRSVNSGWFDRHACVTAAAAGVDGLPSSLKRHLEVAQREDGAWDGYWWADRAYATALAAEALADCSPSEPAIRAARWAAARLDPASATRLTADQDPFGTALLLRTMLPAATAPNGLAGPLNELLAAQRSDGSWTGSARLRIPNARESVVPACDDRRTLTTASVLETLTVLQRAGATVAMGTA